MTLDETPTDDEVVTTVIHEPDCPNMATGVYRVGPYPCHCGSDVEPDPKSCACGVGCCPSCCSLDWSDELMLRRGMG